VCPSPEPPFVNFRPDLLAASVYLADSAVVTGHVSIDEESSVWFGAVVRGDTQPIEIGVGTNVQDLALLHSDAGVVCRLGNHVTVGHAAIVHGAIVGDHCLIGMRATLLNHVRVGPGSLIAAGSLLTEGFEVPPGSVVMGAPATVRRSVTPEDTRRIQYAAEHYARLAKCYRQSRRSP
jgi:carbonic anhydrase/acetyltransferase-like protein (isoleucine patch superfamily)